jgi:quercetin dioxygenase-like cupin family protein
MRIARGRADAPSERREGTFTGRVWIDPVLSAQDGVTVSSVFFEPGARTHWHTHSVGQVLHVTHGEGVVQVRGAEGRRITAGDVVHIRPGEQHWHGAAEESYLLHTAVSLGSTEWLAPVSSSDYAVAQPMR